MKLPLILILFLTSSRVCFHIGSEDPYRAVVNIAYYWSDMTNNNSPDPKAICGTIIRNKAVDPFQATWYGADGKPNSSKFAGLPNAVKFIEGHCPVR